ncbi:MAG: hypothetical protein KBD37_00460 [Burkholderiales bacterium]|nr:hypothetical protein [Burkholderiales bacterium]
MILIYFKEFVFVVGAEEFDIGADAIAGVAGEDSAWPNNISLLSCLPPTTGLSGFSWLLVNQEAQETELVKTITKANTFLNMITNPYNKLIFTKELF